MLDLQVQMVRRAGIGSQRTGNLGGPSHGTCLLRGSVCDESTGRIPWGTSPECVADWVEDAVLGICGILPIVDFCWAQGLQTVQLGRGCV